MPLYRYVGNMRFALPASTYLCGIPLLELIPILLLAGFPGAIESANAREGTTTRYQSGEGGIWLDVPYVRQPEDGCVAACISMILRYWAGRESSLASQYDTDPLAIAKILYTPQVKGIPGTKMEGYMRKQWFRTFVFAGSLPDLTHHLSLGRPLIVCVKPERHHAGLHYLVVAGVDPAAEIILVNDPARRKLLKFNVRSFESAWAHTRNWTLLAVPESHSLLNPSPSP